MRKSARMHGGKRDLNGSLIDLLLKIDDLFLISHITFSNAKLFNFHFGQLRLHHQQSQQAHNHGFCDTMHDSMSLGVPA